MDVAERLSRGLASGCMAGRLYPSLRMDFTSLTGQLSSAGITRTLSAGAHQRVRTALIVDGHDREPSFRRPVEGEIEVARKDLPSRAVIQFNDVALGTGPDPHGAFIPRRRAQCVVRSATSVPTGPARSSC